MQPFAAKYPQRGGQAHLCNCTGGSPSTLELSKEQVATTSCKTCGGIPLVNGIGSSSSMMGTVGLELINYINPELTWKTVAKGNRSTSRRSRKAVTRNSKMSVGPTDKSAKKTENASVSESEKLGVAVLGRRFSDKVEHIPIKKRRFMFRSPSPPKQTPSPHHEDSEQLGDSRQSGSNSITKKQIMATHDSRFSQGVDDMVVDGKISELRSGELGDGEDFSGIEILAAAACNNSMGDDVKESTTEDGLVLTCEGNNSPSSAMPLEETIVSSGTASSFQKEAAGEDNMEGSLSQDNSVYSLEHFPTDKDDRMIKRTASSRDDRLHWDLNVVMDAWEKPGDYGVDSQTNASASVVFEDCNLHIEKLDDLEDCKIQDCGDINNETENRLHSVIERSVSDDAQGDINMVSDFRGQGLRTCGSNTEEQELEACSTANANCFQEKSSSVSTEHALESSMVAVSDAKACDGVAMDACHARSPSPKLHNIGSTHVSDENKNIVPCVIVEQSGEACTSDMQLDKTMCAESFQVKGEVGFSPQPASETNCEIESPVNKDGAGDMMITGPCTIEANHVDVPTGESDEVRVIHLSPNVPASDPSVKEEVRVVHLSPNVPASDPSVKEEVRVIHLSSNVPASDPSVKEEVLISHPSPKCDDVYASGPSVKEGQSEATAAEQEQKDHVSEADTTELDPSAGMESKELVNKISENSTVSGEQSEFNCEDVGKSCDDDPANCSGKVDLGDPFDDSYDTDVSQDDHENTTKLAAGYDSQIEDGELRESAVRSWEENEAEDGEAERVDYESDNRDMYDFDAVDYPGLVAGEVEVGSECEKEILNGSNHFGHEGCQSNIEAGAKEISGEPCVGGSVATEAELSRRADKKIKRGFSTRSGDVVEKVEDFGGGDTLKEPSQTKGARGDQLPVDHEISSDKNLEVNDGRANGPRTTRREVLSRIEGPSSYDVVRRKNSVILQRSRSNNLDDSDPRCGRGADTEKSMGRGRYALHMHGRGQRDGNWDDPSTGHWDSKHHHSPSYHGPYGSGRPRPRSTVESGGFVMTSDRTISKGVAGLNGIHRQSMNSSSKGLYRPLIRRRSPSDRDDAYGMHMGMAPTRDVSPDRSRGRSRRYQGVNRGPREGYHGPISDETTEFPLRMPHHLARRERSISPILNRGAPHYSDGHKISRSRSRSRSPPAWLMLRERNASSRHFSRSPDFRSGARMERVRLPFQKPNFAVDYEEGFVSPPRGRFSPQHNSRWIDDRNGAMDHFRDGRSPVRMFHQGQRFDSLYPPRRLKSNDYYRPMIHSGRLPEMVGAGRGRKHEDSEDDRRKHSDRYEMIRPVRRYDTGGVVKRFRYDTEDCPLSRNPHNNDDCIRGTDRRPRDMPRRASEEKRHLRHNHDRLYNSSPNSFGMRDYDEDASPRRGRPA